MGNSANHVIHSEQRHLGWDRNIPPALTVAPGNIVEFDVIDASGGQLTPDSTAADVAALKHGKLNPLTGPLHVEGAKPGDALKVTLIEVGPSGWGWTANIPGVGLLADQFSEAALHIWSYDAASLLPAHYGPGGRVPLKPAIGAIGLAPGEEGPHGVASPRRVGGNMAIRDLGRGAELYLPVEVEGGLFSVGNIHAAQGEGEVCGSAIESPMKVAFRFDVVNNARLAFPRFDTQGPVARHLDDKGYHVTTGIADDPSQAARDAVRGKLDHLAKLHGMAPVEANRLCSVCADLRIGRIVDQRDTIASLYFPRVVFE